MKRRKPIGRRIFSFTAVLLTAVCLSSAFSLEIHPGSLELSPAAEQIEAGDSIEISLKFVPDDENILDSYRTEIVYDSTVLELSSHKVYSDRFNGMFETMEASGRLSIIYLAEADDLMREPVEMAVFRFRPLDSDYSGATFVNLVNKLTGETQSCGLTFNGGSVTETDVKATSSRQTSSQKASSKTASEKSSSEKSSSAQEETSDSSVLVIEENHRATNVVSSLPGTLRTMIFALLAVLLAAVVAVVAKNRKKHRNSEKKDQSNEEKNL